MTYRPMTHALYQRLCRVVYRLEERERRSRWPCRCFNLRLSKSLFDDHGTFHE